VVYLFPVEFYKAVAYDFCSDDLNPPLLEENSVIVIFDIVHTKTALLRAVPVDITVLPIVFIFY